MLFGIIFLFAALGIGAYVAVTVITPSMVSEDLANSLGMIGDMSLLEIYKTVTELYDTKNIAIPDADGNYYTLGDFAEEYEVDLAALLGFEPSDEFLEIPIFSLFAEDGFNIVLDNTTVNAIFSILGEDILPDYLYSAVDGVSISALLADPFTILLDGIYVGGLLNVSTMSIEDMSGYDTIVYDDNDNTISLVMYDSSTDTYAIEYEDSWCVAKLGDSDLEEGEYTAEDFSVIWYTESGAEASGMYQQLASYTLYALTNSEDIFGEIMDKLTLGDILGDDMEGTMLGNLSNCSIGSLSSEFDEMLIGELLGYTEGSVDIEGTEEGVWYTTATDEEGIVTYTKVTGMESVLADLSISDLNSGDIMGELGDTEVGVLLGYIAGDGEYDTEEGVWYTTTTDENGNTIYTEVSGLDAELANLTIEQLQSGDIMDELGDVKVGVMLGYTQDIPTDDETTDSSPTIEPTNSTTGDDTVDTDTTTDDEVVEEDNRPWYSVSTDENGNTVYTEVAGLDSVLANLTLSDLQSGDIMDLIGDTELGVMLDYTKVYTCDCTEGDEHTDECSYYWATTDSEGNLVEVAGMDAVLADLSLSDLQGGDIMASIGDTELGVMLNYTKVYTCDIDSDHIHDENCEDECQEHEHTSDCYYWATTDENGNFVPVSGMDSVLADLTISDLQSGDIMGLIGDTKLGVMLDYTWGGDVSEEDGDNYIDDNTWYTVETFTDEQGTTTTTYTPVTGMDAVLAEMTLDDLQGGDIMGAMGDTMVGVMLGYIQVFSDEECDHEGEECSADNGCYYWATAEEESVQAGIVTIEVDSEGTQQVSVSADPTYTKVGGMDSVIAELTISQLMSGDLMGEIGDTEVGVLLDYTEGSSDIAGTEEGKWYTIRTDLDGNTMYDNDNNVIYDEVSALDAKIASLSLNDLQDGDLLDKINDLTLAELFGYEKVYTCEIESDHIHDENCDVDCQEHEHTSDCYYWATVDENGEWVEVDAVMNALAECTLEDLQNGEIIDALDDVLLGDLLDYTAGDGETLDANGDVTEEGKWYTTNGNGELEEATGLEAKLAEKTLSELQDGGVADIVDELTLRDVLGDDADEGVFASIGGDTMIGDLNDAIENMLLGDLLELERQIIDTTVEDGNTLIDIITDTTITGTGEDEVSTTVAVGMYGTTYVMCSNYDGNVNSTDNVWYEAKVSTSYQDETTHTVDHFQYIWYNNGTTSYIEDNQATGVIAVLASLTIAELQDGDTLNDTINNMALGEILTIDEETSSALLVSLKDTALGDIPDAIDDTYMGTIQGLYKDETSAELQSDGTYHYTWYTDENCTVGNEVDTLTNQISNLTAGSINDESIFGIVENLTMEEMMDCELIDLDADDEATLDDLFDCEEGDEDDWRDLRLSNFLSELLEQVAKLQALVPSD